MRTTPELILSAAMHIDSIRLQQRTAGTRMLEVSKSMTINAGLDDVWGYAGDFCAISVLAPCC